MEVGGEGPDQTPGYVDCLRLAITQSVQLSAVDTALDTVTRQTGDWCAGWTRHDRPSLSARNTPPVCLSALMQFTTVQSVSHSRHERRLGLGEGLHHKLHQ